MDSSAAAIAAQGLLRLGRYLKNDRYWQAGLTVADTLFDEPYLSTDPKHQGLILHAVYHRPNGWDTIPQGRKVPGGESCMWGDYHALELALYLLRADREQTVSDILERIRVIIADLANRRPDLSGAPAHAEPGGRREPDPGDELLHGQRHARAERRPGAVAQPGAGRDLLHRRRHGEMCLGEERQTLTTGQAVYIPPRRLSPADEHRRRRRCG